MPRDGSSRSQRSRASHTSSAEPRRHRGEGHQTRPLEHQQYSRSSESGNYPPTTTYTYSHYSTGEAYAYNSLGQDNYAGWDTSPYDGDDELPNVGSSSTRARRSDRCEEQTRSQYSSASSGRTRTSHPQTTPSSTYRSTNTAARSSGREIIPYQNPADRASSPSDSDSTLVIDAPRSTETQSDRRHRPRHRDRERAYAYDDYSYTHPRPTIRTPYPRGRATQVPQRGTGTEPVATAVKETETTLRTTLQVDGRVGVPLPP
jgi:hypothetical protein